SAARAEARTRACDLPRGRPWSGAGPGALSQRGLAAHGHDAAPAALRAQLRAAFDVATLSAPLDHGNVFDGIAAMLERLAAAMPLVVVTNKPTALARAVLAAARLLPYLSAVHGADAPAQRKPSPLLLQDAAR